MAITFTGIAAREAAWKAVPLLLLTFLLTGYPYTWRLLAYRWSDPLASKALTVLWAVQFHVCLLPLIYCYCIIAFPLSNLGLPPREPPEVLKQRLVPFECDAIGGADTYCDVCRCYKPARARHCPRHNQCRVGFDHCCPWFDACISLHTIKPFVLFVALAPSLLLPSAAMLFPLVRQHLASVVPLYGSEELHREWWSTWRSWALGPVWRYLGGLVKTYWLHQSRQPYANLSSPHLAPLVLIVLCCFISLVGMVMVYMTTTQLSRGQSTPELERAKRWKQYTKARERGKQKREWTKHRYLWIPARLTAEGKEGIVRRLDPSVTDLYDLGTINNLKGFMGASWDDLLDLRRPPPYAPGVVWSVNEEAVRRIGEQKDKFE